MNARVSEAWARSGAAKDVVLLAQIVACLDVPSRITLQQCAMKATMKDRGARQGEPVEDVSELHVDPLACAIQVMGAFCTLQVESKASLLEAAVDLVARLRLQASSLAGGTWEETDQWLQSLAHETYPRDDDVADLITVIKDFVAEWEEALFPDGPHGIVTVPSEQEIDVAEGMLAGYEMLRNNIGAFNGPPSAVEFLRIEVPTRDFREWDPEFDTNCRFRAFSTPRRQWNQQVRSVESSFM